MSRPAQPDTKRPVPILFTIPNFTTAGTGRAMLNIIERLDRDRFAPAVAVQRDGGALSRVVTEDLGLPLLVAPTSIPAKPRYSLPLRAWRVARTLRPYRFRIWHSFHYADDYTEPIIARLAGASHWIYTKKNDWWGSNAWRMRTRFARCVVTLNSTMQREFFEPIQQAHKARHIPRGVDAQRFHAEARRTTAPALRREFAIPPEAKIVLCCAILVARKNHPALIEALAELPQAHLVLAGPPMEASYVAALRELIRERNMKSRVHFVGYQADMPGLLAQADVFALPSRSEGMPVALLEAMSCGLPVVATALAGARDIVEPGTHGLLVPVDDVRALRTALARLLGDPSLRAQLGAAARQRVEQRFTIDAEARAHEDLYASLVNV